MTSLEDDPLLKLISEHKDEKTILDEHFRQRKNPDVQISLNYRQPSFSSLDENEFITKGGDRIEPIKDTTSPGFIDPLIVFDGKSSDASDSIPINLSVRQPSFTSLHSGNIVPKGVENLSDFEPVIEEVQPLSGSFSDNSEDDNQVKIVKELTAKHSEKWKQMGYEPPSDLIPLVRAASQKILTANESLQKSTTSSSLNQTHPFTIQTPQKIRLETLNEEVSPHQNTTLSRQRSNSFGHAIIQNSELLKNAFPQIDQIDDEIADYDSCEDQDDDSPSLYGRLDQIVDEDPDSVIYQVILSGDASTVKSGVVQLSRKIQNYIDECTKYLYIDEVVYLREVLSTVPSISPRKSSRSTKAKSSIHESQISENEIWESKQADIQSRKKQALAALEQEFLIAAQKLDAKYSSPEGLAKFSKPSRQLLDMRKEAQTFLRANRIDEARQMVKEIEVRAKEEERKATLSAQAAYDIEDKNMKIAFAKKKDCIVKKYEQMLENARSEHENKKATLKRRLANI